MDGRSFDGFTRFLTTGRSRRGTLAVLAGAVPLRGGAREAQAACKKVGRKCDKNMDCCQGAKCKGGRRGRCRCKSGWEECDGDGRCANLDNDLNNCGACGTACLFPDACCDGVCSRICAR